MVAGDITPAICGIVERLATPVLRKNWDDYKTSIFRKEENIYDLAFQACSTAYQYRYPLHSANSIFRTFLTQHGYDLKENEVAFDGVFGQYWELAKRPGVWKNGRQQWEPFVTGLSLWRDGNFEYLTHIFHILTESVGTENL